MDAAERYDPSLGFRFSTYAMWWVRQRVQRWMKGKERTIRLPIHAGERIARYYSTVAKLTQKNLGVRPTDREVAESMGVPFSHLEKLLRREAATGSLSLDAPSRFDESVSLHDVVADTEEWADPRVLLEKKEFVDRVRNILDASGLTPRERAVLELRFGMDEEAGEERTLEEVGKILDGITRERVRQIEAGAKRKVLKALSAAGVKNFGGIG